ncbi:type II secretion system protein E [Clostridium pasteurianum DSM 525 = ATCC 6013]|uniref:Type II secretion system protein E n=1 Tax=Clostridium pasteurianum DSM 525 = ATCC 6013 TaxID=1262449 RepID=A0A0H3J3A6_CLOPA|nr:GspE/PulE family protein [Clostridium pasteurianum]AJA47949.1 type II secretion system protein E [Clostridium pasteurianum DSM 525 = ATCC 6013]AJA51937.1 type II secretion system protein E [Clostridium pasteurianum DSM 525 = ATCC 6013]AOZ75236.1 type II secretion system protein GspE [Clostridium pasteurianum DSM 525 = ATCC 6013]AOZ79031.1 type II secretion system protein GspE [Clostridium pasteurianum]ELP59852.1 general secretion pathway protein E [Clostridium pasteurianum DSM 525 = ATCC 60
MITIENNYNNSIENQYSTYEFIDLDDFEISAESIKVIDKSIAYKRCVFIYKENKNEIFAAMNDPFDTVAINDLRFISQKNVIPFKANKKQIISYIKLFYEIKDSKNTIMEMEKEVKDKKLDNIDDTGIKDSPSVRLIDSIIAQSIARNASDIHIEPFKNYVHVRIRVDGKLQKITKPLKKGLYKSINIALKVKAKMDITTRMLPQDGKIDYVRDGIQYDFRVSSIPTIYGEKFVIRVLYKSRKNISLDELAYDSADAVREFISRSNGIILLCGPTGSGKSTTVYSILEELNKEEKNIVTIEDPVEFTIDNINQVNVNKTAGLTFPVGLRSFLRQDPDVISVGEIRDEETARVAVRAAITGHLVISTLHTKDASGTVVRLLDMGVQNYLLADALIGVIAQRLVRKICPHCKEKYIPDSMERKLCNLKEEQYLYRGRGCSKCNNTGYMGRIAVFEIMKINSEIKKFIYEGESTERVREYSLKKGMKSLKENCLDLIKKGITTSGEYINVIHSSEDY